MIRFVGVHKWFGHIHVLNDINLHVRRGEVVVICGPSGSGKSTLIRTINRLEPINEGRLIVDGIDLADPKTDINKLRAEIGFVFQQFNLYPHLTVLKQYHACSHKGSQDWKNRGTRPGDKTAGTSRAGGENKFLPISAIGRTAAKSGDCPQPGDEA